jgi:predicted ABC-type ATPase
MFRKHVIPGRAFPVHIDPDAIKRKLPEWQLYVKNNHVTAGSLTHLESALMVEIAQEAGLRAGVNLWVDGSLANTAWTLKDISRIRNLHPEYHIGVFHVSASERLITKRCEKRAQSTGRVVPVEKIRESITGSAETIKQLIPPLIDFAAIIRNNGPDPELMSVNGQGVHNDWTCIRRYFE